MSDKISDDLKKIHDTPRTDKAYYDSFNYGIGCLYQEALLIEKEMNEYKIHIEFQDKRIKELEAIVNDPNALWTNWLRGTVSLPSGIGDVRKHQERIKQLENIINRASIRFFADGSDGKTATQMLAILDEARQ